MRVFYNGLSLDPDQDDKWHLHSRLRVQEFVLEQVSARSFPTGTKVINAGSRGNSLNLDHLPCYHVDIANRGLQGKRAVVADIQMLPFSGDSFDLCICVGSVLNYCDAALAIAELARTLKQGGQMIVEFERARTLEFAFTTIFRANAHLVKTFYRDWSQCVWVYSERYIRNILRSHGLFVLSSRRFHILSPLILRLTRSPGLSAYFAKMDGLLEKIPFLSSLACNVILTCEKRA